jgi:hypothetical protein
MARKYSRDNRGRFASSGTGATARGGRLRTATGNKRATQTSQMTAAPRAGTVGKGGKARGSTKPAATVKPTQAPGSRIKAARVGGVSRARLSGQKMNEGAGKRGKARQQRQQTMAIQRQMLGRIKPGKSAEALSTGGTLAARASLRRARAKAGTGASPAQRGAVKRAGTYLKASKERNRAAVKGAASRGTVAKPKGLKQGAVTARVKARAAASKPAASGKRARLDGEAFAARARRANSTALRRGINESDRENALSGAQRRATAPAKRFAASNQRQARADRTAAAAKAFYANYGSPSTFARRQRQSTANSPSFGSKRRGKKKS